MLRKLKERVHFSYLTQNKVLFFDFFSGRSGGGSRASTEHPFYKTERPGDVDGTQISAHLGTLGDECVHCTGVSVDASVACGLEQWLKVC